MISAVILTHNDHEMISDVLESLIWCDERIVIDDFSHDNTRDIAKTQGAIVYKHALHDDFAQQRNFGLMKAKGDWVLFVDSDEIVPSRLRDDILKQIQDDTYVGYFIKRKDFLFGRELRFGETASVKLLRLAKKNAGRWERAVHETWKVQGPVASLTTPLLHYPHPTVRDFLQEINRYTTINAQTFNREGKRVSLWQIIVYPGAKFVQNYIVRLGFFDGTAGFVMAMMMSLHSFLTRSKMWELQRKHR